MRTTHDTTTTAAAPARDGPTQQAGRFIVHVMEMCAVMCATLIVLIVLAVAVTAAADVTNPLSSAPALSAAVVTLALAGSMTAWMRYRSMAWRPTLEMAGSTLVVGALMLTGYAAGLVPASELVIGTCGVACLAMIAVMLFRFRLYASHTDPGGHAAA